MEMVQVSPEKILAGSNDVVITARKTNDLCNGSCALWHICRDREAGQICFDKRVKGWKM